MWRKKIEKDVSQGVPLDEFSLKAEKKRQRERKVRLLSCTFFFLKSSCSKIHSKMTGSFRHIYYEHGFPCCEGPSLES